VTAQAFYGGLTPGEKEEVINKFRRRGGVLVSTECGSEGRNLQFCRTMVNYDLPWNPMRLEQRIGRIHRLGQTSDVLIINLVTEGTVEAYLLYLLERKINMFQKVIGEIEAVMATLPAPYERILAHLVLDSESEAQVAERFAAFGNELAQACDTYERVRRLNHQLFSSNGHLGETGE
jgi:superfamily II DNA/RNA helicase